MPRGPSAAAVGWPHRCHPRSSRRRAGARAETLAPTRPTSPWPVTGGPPRRGRGLAASVPPPLEPTTRLALERRPLAPTRPWPVTGGPPRRGRELAASVPPPPEPTTRPALERRPLAPTRPTSPWPAPAALDTATRDPAWPRLAVPRTARPGGSRGAGRRSARARPCVPASCCRRSSISAGRHRREAAGRGHVRLEVLRASASRRRRPRPAGSRRSAGARRGSALRRRRAASPGPSTFIRITPRFLPLAAGRASSSKRCARAGFIAICTQSRSLRWRWPSPSRRRPCGSSCR